MPITPKRAAKRPWMAKRPYTFKGNKGEDAAFYNSRTWRTLRKYVLSGEPLCRECGTPAKVVDHIRPISQGGAKLDIENLQPLCTSCHNKKSSREGKEKINEMRAEDSAGEGGY